MPPVKAAFRGEWLQGHTAAVKVARSERDTEKLHRRETQEEGSRVVVERAFGVQGASDGTVKQVKAYAPQASLRLANVYPNEPEAMAVLSSYEFAILSARKDDGGNYVHLASRPVTGSNFGNGASPPGACCGSSLRFGGGRPRRAPQGILAQIGST